MPALRSPSSTTTHVRTPQEHRRARAAAEQRRATAERELHRLHLHVRHDLPNIHRRSETTVIVARSAVAELCTRTLGHIAARLGGACTDL